MALYDIFIKNHHPNFMIKYLIKANKNIIRYILPKINKKNISILEIGPGKGYFFKATQSYDNIEYSALDRNELVLSSLPNHIEKYYAQLPELPQGIKRKFDIIYCAYVIEHLSNGEIIYDFVNKYKEIINEGGYLILLAPDYMRQNREFFNIDYTHKYPTTKRNICMILKDAGYKNIEIHELNGILYHKYFYIDIINFFQKIILFAFNYKVLNFLFGRFLTNKVYDTDNVFYKGYCLLKQENIIFISKKG